MVGDGKGDEKAAETVRETHLWVSAFLTKQDTRPAPGSEREGLSSGLQRTADG